MFPHLARDMREHVALAWEIDTKHRARQHLSHRAFRHDLLLLRHRRNILSNQAALNRRAVAAALQASTSRRDVITAHVVTNGFARARPAVDIRSTPAVSTMR